MAGELVVGMKNYVSLLIMVGLVLLKVRIITAVKSFDDSCKVEVSKSVKLFETKSFQVSDSNGIVN